MPLFDTSEIEDADVWLTACSNSSSCSSSKTAVLAEQLRSLEQNLRCMICGDFFRIPVLLRPCCHSFCSTCIRASLRVGLNSLKRQANCPVCRVGIDTGGSDFDHCLVPNRSVEEMTMIFQSLRSSLLQVLSNSSATTTTTTTTMDDEAAAESDTAKRPPSRPRPRPRPTAPSTGGLQSTNNSNANNNNNNNNEVAVVVERRKKLRRPHYKNMKRRQLVELCAVWGLSTGGNDREMQTRHEQFVQLYNAECDSFQPRPVADLVHELSQQEQHCRNHQVRHTHHQSPAVALQQLKTNGSTENEHFNKQLKSNFAKLIAQARPRRPDKGKTAMAATKTEETENITDGEQAAAKNATLLKTDTTATTTNNDQDDGSHVQVNMGSEATEPVQADESQVMDTAADGAHPGTVTDRNDSLPAEGPKLARSVVNAPLEGVDDWDAAEDPADDPPAVPPPAPAVTVHRAPAWDRSREDVPLDDKDDDIVEDVTDNYVEKRASTLSNDSASEPDNKKRSSWSSNLEEDPNGTLQTQVKKQRTSNPSFATCTKASLASVSNKERRSASGSRRPSLDADHIIGPWQCPRCTLINERNTWSRASCEACGYNRGQAVANTSG